MSKKILVVFAVILTVAMLAVGCSGQPTASTSPSAEASASVEASAAASESAEASTPASGDKIKIRFSQATMAGPFYVSEVDAAKAAAEAARRNSLLPMQTKMLQSRTRTILDMIQSGIQVSILNFWLDPDGVLSLPSKRKNAGIPDP